MNATEQVPLARRLDALEQKLDRVLAEIDELGRIRREAEELKDDLARVGHDMFRATVHELEGAAPFVQSGDLAELAQRLLRNVTTLNELLVQLESAREFLADATPLGRQLFSDLLAKFDELDRNGYFAVARELHRGIDDVVRQLKPEHLRAMADSLVPLLETAQAFSNPRLLRTLRQVAAAGSAIELSATPDYSLWQIIREANSAEVRRGLGFALAFLRQLGAPTPLGPAWPVTITAPTPPLPQPATASSHEHSNHCRPIHRL